MCKGEALGIYSAAVCPQQRCWEQTTRVESGVEFVSYGDGCVQSTELRPGALPAFRVRDIGGLSQLCIRLCEQIFGSLCVTTQLAIVIPLR